MDLLLLTIWFIAYFTVIRFIPRSVLSDEHCVVLHLSCVVLPFTWVLFYPDGTFIGEWLFALSTGLATVVLAVVSFVLIFRDRVYVLELLNLGISLASAVGLWLVLF